MFNEFFVKIGSIDGIPNLLFRLPSDLDLNTLRPNLKNDSIEFIEPNPVISLPILNEQEVKPLLNCHEYVITDLIKKDLLEWIDFFKSTGKVNSENEVSFYVIINQLKDNTLNNSIDKYPEKNKVYNNILASILLIYLISISESKKDYKSFYPILFGGEKTEVIERMESQIILEYLNYLKSK